jgi:hypothetical protein
MPRLFLSKLRTETAWQALRRAQLLCPPHQQTVSLSPEARAEIRAQMPFVDPDSFVSAHALGKETKAELIERICSEERGSKKLGPCPIDFYLSPKTVQPVLSELQMVTHILRDKWHFRGDFRRFSERDGVAAVASFCAAFLAGISLGNACSCQSNTLLRAHRNIEGATAAGRPPPALALRGRFQHGDGGGE